MKVWKKSKGNRIRASDQSLVYHFCIGWLLLLFVAVFLLLNLRQLLVTNWKDFNLLHAGITGTAYNFITVLIATGVCASVAFLYYRYGYDRISGCYTDKSWLVWCWKINGMKQKTPKTAVFSLTCKADPEKKSCGFRKSTTRWTTACSISCVKSQWENIKNSSCP